MTKSITALIGHAKIVKMTLNLDTQDAQIQLADVPKADGGTCTPSLITNLQTLKENFTLEHCTTDTDSSNAFTIEEYGAQTFVDVFNNTKSDQVQGDAITFLSFTGEESGAAWTMNSSNIRDKRDHRELFNGRNDKP